MPMPINALDSEFAISSGRNVNTGSGPSTFDHPPSSTSNLVIRSASGDPASQTFDVGSIYVVSFSRDDSEITLKDAAVVRSDLGSLHSDQGGAVVFEGQDDNGDLIQVVWSPDFDLEQWYWDHHAPQNPPGFYTTDHDSAIEYRYVCFGFGTKVDTVDGPVPVERLRAGQAVRTQDNGPQRIMWTGQSLVPGRGDAAPVRFDAGALGNTSPLILSQQHRVLIADPLAEVHFGAHEVFVPAKALAGLPGINIVTTREVGYCHFMLPEHEVVQAEGLLCESMYFGDIAKARLARAAQREIASSFPRLPGLIPASEMGEAKAAFKLARPTLRMYEARRLVSLIWDVELPAEPRHQSGGILST